MRGIHPKYVFTYKGHPVTVMNNTAWKRARKNTALEQVRVHDLRHTFGRRLRAAGVSLEDREDLLGHKSGRMTTHYSAAEVSKLLDAANKVNCNNQDSMTLTVLKRRMDAVQFCKGSRESHVQDLENKKAVVLKLITA